MIDPQKAKILKNDKKSTEAKISRALQTKGNDKSTKVKNHFVQSKMTKNENDTSTKGQKFTRALHKQKEK